MENGLEVDPMDLDNINAPQFVDFMQPLTGDDEEDVESYFDYDHENGQPVSFDTPSSFYLDAKDSSACDTPVEYDNKSSTITPKNNSLNSCEKKLSNSSKLSHSFGKNEGKSEINKEVEPKKVLSNLCTDLTAWRKNVKDTVSSGKVTRASPANSITKIPAATKRASPANSSTKIPAATRRDASPSIKKLTRRSAAATPEMSKQMARITTDQKTSRHTRTRSVEPSPAAFALKRSNSMRSVSEKRNLAAKFTAKTSRKSSEKTEALKPKVTLPSTPTFMKREMKFSHTNQSKSTEEMEMQKIREFQKTLAQKRKAQEQFRQKAMTATACKPTHSAVPLTKPEEFNFKTDTRVKATEIRSSSKERDFTSQLRSIDISSEQKLLPKKTVPHPFSFDRKRKHESELTDAKYVSDAEKINKFTATPERFRSKPCNKEPSPAKRRRRSMSQPHLTMPKTPNFQTKGRHRPVLVKSQVEIDEEEIAEINKYKFHARPVNEKIFENSCMGVKKVAPKVCTVPHGFDLETERRNDTWKNKSSEKEESYHFHANPVPKTILEGTVGVKPAKSIPLTQPESPAFALKNRLRSTLKMPEVLPQEEKKMSKAKPAPHHGLPYQPKFETKITETKPFSFEERNRRQQKMKEEKIKRMQEEDIKQPPGFHAKPIPDLSPVLPAKKTKPLTKPDPFNFEVDVRGAHKAEEWSSKLKEELKNQREMAKFKAKPNKVVGAEPFVPKRSTKPLTVIDDFELNIDVRAGDREKWEEWKHTKGVEQDEIRRAKERQQNIDEQKEIDQLRKGAVPKAQPIRKFKEIELKPSNKELTQPQTPRFSERLKTRAVRL